MWVITAYKKDGIHIFEYTSKIEATKMLEAIRETAILSYTK